jgi:hypothetical protein
MPEKSADVSSRNVGGDIATLICLDICVRWAVIGYCWGCFSPASPYLYGGRYPNRYYRGDRVVVVRNSDPYYPPGPGNDSVVIVADAENMPPLENLTISR